MPKEHRPLIRVIQKPWTFAERSLLRLVPAALVAGALLVPARTTRAASTPEQICQEGRYAAAVKYAACHDKAMAMYFAGQKCFTTEKYEQRHSRCRVKYTAMWANLQAVASGTGATCDAVRFAVSEGTVTDKLTGLQWEQKTDDGSVHDTDNLYTWSASAGSANADGTVYTSFLATLNGAGCFANHCDWRLPTISELLTILLEEPYPCTTSPCIDQTIFGPLASSGDWTSKTCNVVASAAWSVNFHNGNVFYQSKNAQFAHVRAVRGGL